MNIANKKNLQKIILLFAFLLAATASASVVNTKHNLAHWSPYAYRATTESRVCIFCHTPHNAEPAGPLWGHQLSGAATFKKYSSGTLQILKDPTAQASSGYTAGEITGATKLCLGCHDGLTALGAVINKPAIEMTVANLGGSSSGYNVSSDTVSIQNKHPVSFNYNATVATDINNAKGEVRLGIPDDTNNGTSANAAVEEMVRRAGGRIECTICHDPHENKATENRDVLPFWVSGEVAGTPFGTLSSYEAVCVSCHAQSFGEYTGFADYTSLR